MGDPLLWQVGQIPGKDKRATTAMKIGSLCTGYGGLDLAVEAVTGAQTVWYAEFDKHAAKIMEHHRPKLVNLWDLTKVDWSQVEPIDILTAGYPCQPFSQAGQRKGTNDSRHIWPSIATAISLLRPKLVVLENVRGHLNLGFDQVLATLTTIGYDAKWEIVRASDVGAPHQRARLFVVAYPQGSRWGSQQDKQESGNSPAKDGMGIVNQSDIGTFSHSIGKRCQDKSCCKKSTISLKTDIEFIANANCNAHKKSRRVDQSVSGTTREIINGSNREINWGGYQNAITRWENLTRACPMPFDKENRLSPMFVEWMMGLPVGLVTDTSLSRTQQLKALGNGVVPQQAAYALELLLQ